MRRGYNVRAASRSPVAARSGIQPTHFDWADRSNYQGLLNGVEAMCLVPRAIPQSEHAGYITSLLEGAVASGVKRA